MSLPPERPASAQEHGLYPSKQALEVAFRAVHKAKIPQVPDVVLALRAELEKAEPDLGEVTDLIAKDAALAGRVLKTINSPFFFCPTKISSIQRAVSMLGATRIANLVTAEVLARIVGAREGASKSVWDSILEQARVTAAVARHVDGIGDDEAYLFAIMHDVGSLIFSEVLRDYGSEWMLRSSAEPQSLLAYERQKLGVDHPTVGFLLAGTWRLPDYLALAVYHHHGDLGDVLEDSRARSLVAASKLASSLVAIRHGIQESAEMLDERESALNELALSEASLARLTDDVSLEI